MRRPSDQEIVAIERWLVILPDPKRRGTHATRGHVGKHQVGPDPEGGGENVSNSLYFFVSTRQGQFYQNKYDLTTTKSQMKQKTLKVQLVYL